MKHFRTKYTSEPDLPIWMVCEAISFGQISQLVKGLKKKDRKAGSNDPFGIDQILMPSWLHTVVYVRNLCAHHSRVWNRVLAIRPMRNTKDRAWDQISNDKIFAVFFIAKSLSADRNERGKWISRLLSLIKEYPDVNIDRMGFPDGWCEMLTG